MGVYNLQRITGQYLTLMRRINALEKDSLFSGLSMATYVMSSGGSYVRVPKWRGAGTDGFYNVGGAYVSSFDRDGVAEAIGTIEYDTGVGASAKMCAYDNDNDYVFVVAYVGGSPYYDLQRFNGDLSGRVNVTGAGYGIFYNYEDMAVANDTLFFIENNTNRCHTYTLGGVAITDFAVANNPTDITANDTYIWVRAGGSQIYKYLHDGTAVTNWTITGGTGGGGICFYEDKIYTFEASVGYEYCVIYGAYIGVEVFQSEISNIDVPVFSDGIMVTGNGDVHIKNQSSFYRLIGEPVSQTRFHRYPNPHTSNVQPLKTPDSGVASPLSTDFNGMSAWSTFTMTGNATTGEAVTLAARDYTFRTTLSGIEDEVKIGANASATINNLIAAIMGGAGEGTTYGLGTVPHASVGAIAGAGNTMIASAYNTGTAGNSINTSDATANGSWTATTLGGANPAAPYIKVTTNAVTDMRAAIEALAPYYVNAVTGDPFNWTASHTDNLYFRAVGTTYDWDAIASRVNENELNEIDACLTLLEASDRI